MQSICAEAVPKVAEAMPMCEERSVGDVVRACSIDSLVVSGKGLCTLCLLALFESVSIASMLNRPAKYFEEAEG